MTINASSYDEIMTFFSLNMVKLSTYKEEEEGVAKSLQLY